MAKKYKNVETKVSPVTIISIILFVVALITLSIVLQPSAKSTLTKQYLNYGVNANIKDEYQFKDENHITPLDHLDNNWFGLQKGLYSEIKKDQVTIVFFGNPTDANSLGSLAYVEYYLYKNDDAKDLRENVKQIYHFDTKAVVENKESKHDIVRVLAKITKDLGYEDDVLVSSSLPTLVAFKNGEVLEVVSGIGAPLTANQIRDFYTNVQKDITKK